MQTNSSNTADVLIIGAGLSGLLAAGTLQVAGRQVLVVDKGRGVGGRMATRRIDAGVDRTGVADHGAQFFTVRSPAFRRIVDDWLAQGLVFEWSRGWSDGSIVASGMADGYPRYAVSGGFTAVPRHLARTLPVQTGVQITAVTPAATGWQAIDATGRRYHGRGLILTAPVPQSLALLDAGGVALNRADRAALERIAYAPCICGIFHVNGAVDLPEPGALQRPEAPISWIADNQRKGISPAARVLTVHAGPGLSRALWDEPDAVALAAVREGLRAFLAADAVIITEQLKRWRYALPTVLHPERTLIAQDLPPLACAGDAFGGPRIEGAALSGLAAAETLSTAV